MRIQFGLKLKIGYLINREKENEKSSSIIPSTKRCKETSGNERFEFEKREAKRN